MIEKSHIHKSVHMLKREEICEDRVLIIIHYAGLDNNQASGINIIVPQIVHAQANLARVGFYNYGKDCLPIEENVTILSNASRDDYHSFPAPFNHPNIVLFHSPFGIPRIVHLAKRLIKERIPYIIVPHGCFSEISFQQKYLKKVMACNLYFRTLINQASAIQFLSKGEKKRSRYNKKGIVISNGVDIPAEVSSFRNTDHIVISYIGRKNIYQKGLDLFMDACQKVRKSLQEHVIVNLYGPIDEDEVINGRIRDNGLQKIVFNHPPVFGQEKERVLRESSLLVLTSRCEGQPVIVLEAWANGCPALLTPETNMAEEAVANGCGWRTEGNSESIANTLLKIVDSRDELCSFSKNAYDHAKHNYQWSVVTKKALSIYQRIVREYGTDE